MARSPGGWLGMAGVGCAAAGLVAACIREYPYRYQGPQYQQPHSKLVSLAYEIGGATLGITLFALGAREGHRSEREREEEQKAEAKRRSLSSTILEEFPAFTQLYLSNNAQIFQHH